MMFGGIQITVSEHATEEITLFPDRKRTKRGMRRLRAKYGPLQRRVPCAFKTPFGLVMHPTFYAEFRARTHEASHDR